MKKTFLPVMVVLVLILSVVLPGCSGATAGGEVITEKKDVTGFNSLDIGSAFEAEITRADTYGVIITADESLFEYIEVTKTNSELRIYLKPRHIFTDFTLGKHVLKAVITMPSIAGLKLSGASKGTLTGFISTADLVLDVSGASALKMVSIKAGKATADVSGASQLTGNITAANGQLEISGASSTELSGAAGILNIEVSGASRANLENFPANRVGVVVSGASEATVYVHETLDIDVSGASRLYFIGNPTMGKTEVSGASTIKHKE